MKRIPQLIEALRKRADLAVADEPNAWRIVIAKGRDLFCEVTVPHSVLEWRASVKHRREKKEAWTDWMDYEGYDKRPREALEEEMVDDVLAFLDRASAKEPLLPINIYEERA
jgi:hypothetical protein